MRRLMHSIGLLALFALILGAVPPSGVSYAQSNQPDFTIHLKSRRFVPAPGLEQALENQLRGEDADRLHALVQLFGPPSADTRGALESQGVQLLGFIPNHAWLASIPNDVETLRSLLGGQVRWFGQLQTNDKISPFVRAGVFHSVAAQPGGYVDLVVTFFDDVDQAAATAVVQAHGGSVIGNYPGGHKLVARVHQGQIRTLAGEDSVQWIAQVPPDKQALNDQVRESAGMNLLASDFDGYGVTAAMWDAGYPGAHKDFLVDDGNTATTRVVRGDTTGGVHNHASHVAGTMAGDGSLLPDLKYMGMAPAAGILSYYWDNSLADHLHAADNEAALSQNSWGYTTNMKSFCYWGAYIWDAPEYDQIVRGYLGSDPLARLISVQFAAGNDQGAKGPCHDGSGYDTIGPPGTAKNIVTVGAINTNDSSMTSFSSWGPMDDGRLKPDVVAGGCQSGGDNGVTSTLPNDSYGVACGTSMATPAVSGLGAVLIEHYQSFLAAQPVPSTLKAILIHTARDLGNVGPDYQFGYGAIDALAAADLISTKQVVEGALAVTDSLVKTVKVPSGATELRATLVWSDKEAEENAAKTLVNDLELVVTDPSGNRHYPWVLDPSNPAANATLAVDGTNPVEQVLVTDPASGDWTITVVGSGIQNTEPYPVQSFSLVWSVVSSEPVTDIAVTAVSAPSSVVQGDIVSVDVTVENVGNQDVTSDIKVTLTDDTDGPTIGTQTISGGLAAGASTTLTYSWDTGSSTLGDHTLTASHDLADEDASNDSKSTVVTVESVVTDIAVTAVSAPSPVVEGDIVDVDVTVENVGNQDVTSDITVTLEDDTDGVTIDAQTISGGLAAGASTTLTYSWNTGGASLGDHTLTASHDFADDDLSNNSKSTTVNISETSSDTHIGDLDGNSINNGSVWTAEVTITVHDGSHNSVANATVTGTWSGRDIPTGTTGECTTNDSGQCTVSLGSIPKRTSDVTFIVEGVAPASLNYNSSHNHDPDGDSDGTLITVAKP